MAVETQPREPEVHGLTGGPGELSAWSAALRESVRREAAAYSERLVLVAESFRASEAEPWREIRWARGTEHVMAHCPILVRRASSAMS